MEVQENSRLVHQVDLVEVQEVHSQEAELVLVAAWD